MSFTQAETLFAGAHELGINDLLREFFTARPRLLNYGTPGFVPVSTVSATAIPAVTFPGIPGGLEFAVSFSIPTVDINPDSSGGTAALLPGPGQLTVQTKVRFVVQCGFKGDPSGHNPGPFTNLSASLQVFGLCRPIVISSTPGTGQIGVQLDQIEIVDIKPDELESVVECIVKMILQGVLANFRLPFNTITAGAFGLILLAGPLAEQDQIKVRGNAL